MQTVQARRWPPTRAVATESSAPPPTPSAIDAPTLQYMPSKQREFSNASGRAKPIPATQRLDALLQPRKNIELKDSVNWNQTKDSCFMFLGDPPVTSGLSGRQNRTIRSVRQPLLATRKPPALAASPECPQELARISRVCTAPWRAIERRAGRYTRPPRRKAATASTG